MNLFDLVKENGGLDICDKDWDWGTYFDFSEDSEDYYDKCMMKIAKQIEVIKVRENWYSPCEVSKMIVNNIESFKKFFNEENREGYRPMDYENSDDSQTDDGFFEAYMEGLESLIVGNYCDEDYKKLFELL